MASNTDIARIFDEVADILEIEGANPFRVRAYRRAAQVISQTPESLAAMLKDERDVSELEGIGKDLAAKIDEICRTGSLKMLDEQRKKIPPGLAQLLNVPGLGPKRAKFLHKELGIDGIEALRQAASAGRLSALHGFGARSEAKILASLDMLTKRERRHLIHDVTPVADALVAHLKQVKGAGPVVVAGSYRRRKETVGDLDILAAAADSGPLMDAFTGFSGASEVVSHGTTRSTIVLRDGLQVDLRVVAPESHGAALHYFTGSKPHNIAVRRLGQKKGLKINEYGVFRDDERIGGRTEEEVFESVGIPYIEPELRENEGELDAAAAGTLPDLVTVEDIKGDLHSHTTATDGKDSLLKMARAAEALGYEYLAVTDHTPRTAIANGMDATGFARQAKEIDTINAQLDHLTVLKSAEVDILKDGRIDLPDETLGTFDIVVCSLHFPGNLDRKTQTERILTAMQNRHANILGHPSGRLIGRRDAYDVDMEKIVRAAEDGGWCLELNAQPKRLDLDAPNARMAKEHGVPLVVSTDAHNTKQFDFMRYGIDQARRAWLEKKDVLNTSTLAQLRKKIGR